MNSTTITIPKELAKSGNLVLIPQGEYEKLLFKARGKKIKTYKPTKAELEAIKKGKEEIARGEYVTLEQLKNELESKSH